MTHWAMQYVGRPWEYGQDGPNSFDCWGFVRAVQREHFGINIPPVQVPTTWALAHDMLRSHQERSNWTMVDDPREGDLVLMARNRRPVHIGVMVQANGHLGVLHCMEPSGVVFSSIGGLVAVGWGTLTYYRRLQCN